jgi:hypothetical protein
LYAYPQGKGKLKQPARGAIQSIWPVLAGFWDGRVPLRMANWLNLNCGCCHASLAAVLCITLVRRRTALMVRIRRGILNILMWHTRWPLVSAAQGRADEVRCFP